MTAVGEQVEQLRLELVEFNVQHELDDVLTFLRRHERDQLLGIRVPPLGQLIDALVRGEHRR